jgi:hypothetical protein
MFNSEIVYYNDFEDFEKNRDSNRRLYVLPSYSKYRLKEGSSCEATPMPDGTRGILDLRFKDRADVVRLGEFLEKNLGSVGSGSSENKNYGAMPRFTKYDQEPTLFGTEDGTWRPPYLKALGCTLNHRPARLP